MRKPPKNFQSWLQFYDHLKKEKPELLRGKTLILMQGVMSFDIQQTLTPTVVKISVNTLKRYCWQEIENKRMSDEDTFLLFHAIEMGHNLQHPQIQEIIVKARTLLNSISYGL